MKVLVALLAAGFVAALVFSWIYELTPEGLKRDGEVSPAESMAPQTARRMDRMIIVALLLALAYFAVDKFVLAPGRVATSAAATVASADVSTPADASAEQPPNQGALAGGDRAAKPIARGIAVLPFDNLSPDPDNAFFAGGVYEEVLTKLSRIGELRVISRTSMERIAEEKLEVGEIGTRLGVSHVLVGSVRRAGDQIRVTVQLIEAASDAQVWADNYDRKLDDVFAIQSEIALAIAGQLELSLSPELKATLDERPTENQAAYALYLRALEERRVWRGWAGFQAMIDLLEPAVAGDPGFLDAQVLLADAYGRMRWLHADPDGSFEAKARRLVADIVRRWPDHPRSEVARGQLAYNLERDYAQALAHFEAAREALPNDVGLLNSISGSLKRLRRHDEFLTAARSVVALDPEAPQSIAELGIALLRTGRLDEAVETLTAARAHAPTVVSLAEVWVRAKLARDRDLGAVTTIDPAIADLQYWRDILAFLAGDTATLLEPVVSGDIGPLGPLGQVNRTAWRAELLQLAGQSAEADVQAGRAQALLAAYEASGPARSETIGSFQLAITARVLALSGQRERAREHLARALDLQLEDAEFAYRRILAHAELNLGEVEAAWLLIQPFADDGYVLSHGELLAFKAYYDQVYGESPSYRAYMAKIAAGSP
jgi:TolB-like protein